MYTHIKTNNILIAVALVIFVAMVVYAGRKSWRKSERKWMEKRMQTEYFKRIREMLSDDAGSILPSLTAEIRSNEIKV